LNISYANPIGALGSTATRISYFINGDATESDPQMVMSGDCNIGNNSTTSSSTPAAYRFGASASTAAAKGCTTAYAMPSGAWNGGSGIWWSWTQGDLHQKTGNLMLSDGSAQSATVSGLHTYLQNGTNSVATPVFNFIN